MKTNKCHARPLKIKINKKISTMIHHERPFKINSNFKIWICWAHFLDWIGLHDGPSCWCGIWAHFFIIEKFEFGGPTSYIGLGFMMAFLLMWLVGPLLRHWASWWALFVCIKYKLESDWSDRLSNSHHNWPSNLHCIIVRHSTQWSI